MGVCFAIGTLVFPIGLPLRPPNWYLKKVGPARKVADATGSVGSAGAPLVRAAETRERASLPCIRTFSRSKGFASRAPTAPDGLPARTRPMVSGAEALAPGEVLGHSKRTP